MATEKEKAQEEKAREIRNEKQRKLADAIKLWKEFKVGKVEFNFSCGGDSMNDTDITIFGENETDIIVNGDLENYFNDATYDNVDFYVNSDGHYQGESGIVHITLGDDNDDFDYNKSATSEWNETIETKIEMKLTKKEAKFIAERVFNINGGETECTINFKGEFILTDKEEILLEKLEDKISQFTNDYEPEIEDGGEADDWFAFTTNEDGEELQVIDDKLIIEMRNQYTSYKESDGY